VDVKVINGVRCTNRVGAADYLHRSLETINRVASPKRRSETGWPAAQSGRVDGQEWYALDDLDRFRESYFEAKRRAGRARVHSADIGDDPDRLISGVEFAELIDVKRATWSRYVAMSLPDWRNNRDGYLPRPDEEHPAPHGIYRFWKQSRAVTWINRRPGSASCPGRRRAARDRGE
jgi:hypothetical protein